MCGNIFKVVVVLSVLSLLASCNSATGDYVEFVPAAPDYSENELWYIAENDVDGNGADVFYLVSTWETDWTTDDNELSHYADVYNPGHRERMSREISGIMEFMGKGNNFYSPYYRHMTIDIWQTQNEDTIDNRFKIPFDDVCNAFDYFVEHHDKNRPIILAGFSQGGKAVVELLKNMDADVRKRLVAAYVLGYKVTPADTLACPYIKAAKGSSDTGVTVCYNSVRSVEDIKPVVAAPCAFCINPVNWKTDATPAILHDTITVSVNPEHHVLILDGYSGCDLQPIRGFLNVGDFHGAEPWLYSECLEENLSCRIAAYRAGD